MASIQDRKLSRPAGAATSRGDDRQAQLLEIAGRLFAKNGFKGTSLRDIAEEAMAGFGQDFRNIVEDEPDAALGNGGLGQVQQRCLGLLVAHQQLLAAQGDGGLGRGGQVVKQAEGHRHLLSVVKDDAHCVPLP